MREPLPKRDQREIVVPARGGRTAPPRRNPSVASPKRTGANWLAFMGRAAGGSGRLVLRRPGEVLGSLVALGAVTAVAMNALGYQGGPHPAPIFPTLGGTQSRPTAEKPHAAKTSEAVKTSETTRTADIAKVAEAPVRKIEAPRPEPEHKAVAEAEPVRPSPSRPAVAPPAAKRDVIAEIIKAGETTASVTPKSDAAVAQAQRALVKLGYGPLTADGILGPGTRSAIAKFERDRKLPVKGVAAGRTLRELAASAGLPKG